MRKRRLLVTAVGVCLTAWLGLAWLVDHEGASGWKTYSSGEPEVVVVLGARVNEDGTASPTLRARVEHAVKTFPRGLFLFSGGVGTYGASEASVARAVALELGVPPERCLIEEESHSTAQNARFSVRLLREKYPRGFHVTVVSDPYHLLRASMLFKRQGEAPSASPVLDAPRHREWPSRALWALREVPALLKDWLEPPKHDQSRSGRVGRAPPSGVEGE